MGKAVAAGGKYANGHAASEVQAPAVLDCHALGGALAQVKTAERLLEDPSPAKLDHCSDVLAGVILKMREWQSRRPPGTGTAEAAGQAQVLRAAVLRCAQLLEKAAEFRAGWELIAALMCEGYTGGGTAAERAHGARICIRG